MKKTTIFSFLMFLAYTLGYAQELVSNGNFESGVTGWSGNAANVVTQNGNSFNEANVATAGNAWDVNLSQTGISLTAGQSYTFKFDAWSDRSRTVIAGLGLNANPWTSSTQTVNLTTTSQTFILTLTAPVTSTNCRVFFDMGAAAGYVGIDNVSLIAVTTPSPSTAAPTPPARPSSDVVSIFSNAYTNVTIDTFSTSWDAADVTDIQIQGNDTKKYVLGSQAFIGMEMFGSPLNLNGFTHFHTDIWVPNLDTGDVLLPKIVNWKQDNSGANNEIEYTYAFTDTADGTWVSIDAPLSSFAITGGGSALLDKVTQVIFGTSGTLASETVYVDNIYFHKNTVLGISKAQAKANVRVYPNPARAGEMVTIDGGVKSFEVFSLNGQKIRQSSSKNINTEGLEKGVYIIKTKTGDGEVQSSKLIVK